jgi:hypothetical protein
LKLRNSTSTIHLDGHPDYTGSADEITPRPWTLPYVANYPLQGKSLLDVGTASGFLAFSAEAQGAIVTSLECRDASDLQRVPFVSNLVHTDRPRWDVEANKQYDSMKLGFWYAWHKLNSRISVSYTPLRDLPYYDETFDVVVAGAILEHLSDPVSTIGYICRMAREAVIIAFTPLYPDKRPFMAPMNPWSDPQTDGTWWMMSEGLVERVFANLGFTIELYPAQAVHLLGETRREQRPTIVARRISPLGGQPLPLDDAVMPWQESNVPSKQGWLSRLFGKK